MDDTLNRIIELLGQKHGEIKKLADYLGIKGNNITNWKAGRSDAYKKYLPQIATYYGVSLDWLTGLSDQKEKPVPISEDEHNVDIELSELLKRLTPSEADKVRCFVQGIISAR